MPAMTLPCVYIYIYIFLLEVKSMKKGMRILVKWQWLHSSSMITRFMELRAPHHLKGQFKQFARRINVGGPRRINAPRHRCSLQWHVARCSFQSGPEDSMGLFLGGTPKKRCLDSLTPPKKKKWNPKEWTISKGKEPSSTYRFSDTDLFYKDFVQRNPPTFTVITN